MPLLGRIITNAISTAVGVLVRDQVREWKHSLSQKESDGFPPIPSEELLASLNELGTNLCPVFTYQDYGIVYGDNALTLSNYMPSYALQFANDTHYVLFNRSSVNVETLRTLSLMLGRAGINLTFIAVELK